MSSRVASSWATPVICSNLPKDLSLILSNWLLIALLHFAGMKPQDEVVVVGEVGRLVVVVVEVVDETVVVVVVSMVPGESPHPTRVAVTSMLSKFPPMVVAAPPKLSTPKPIQSRV